METVEISLLGAGGMALEIISFITDSHKIQYLYDGNIKYDKLINLNEEKYVISNKFKEQNYHIMAAGYPQTKEQIVKNINSKIKLADALIHRRAMIGKNVEIGDGSIVYPTTVLTIDITVGEMSSINSTVTIGHNCRIGKMFHASPGSVVSGNVTIGDRVFMGANSCIKEKISICSDVIIGAGAVVVKDITERGVYIGNPARKMK